MTGCRRVEAANVCSLPQCLHRGETPIFRVRNTGAGGMSVAAADSALRRCSSTKTSALRSFVCRSCFFDRFISGLSSLERVELQRCRVGVDVAVAPVVRPARAEDGLALVLHEHL